MHSIKLILKESHYCNNFTSCSITNMNVCCKEHDVDCTLLWFYVTDIKYHIIKST